MDKVKEKYIIRRLRGSTELLKVRLKELNYLKDGIPSKYSAHHWKAMYLLRDSIEALEEEINSMEREIEDE